jgi:predicted ester cyclase
MKNIFNLNLSMQTARLAYVVIAAIGLTSMVGCHSKPNFTTNKETENASMIPFPESSTVDVSEMNKALVLKMYEQFDKGELSGFVENISTDFKCNVLGNTDLDWNGFIQFGNGFLNAFPDGKHNFQHVIAKDENVVTIGTYTGTHLKEMQGLAPTNSRIVLSVMHLDRVVNGKIVEHRGIANQVQLMNQLGFKMVPQK